MKVIDGAYLDWYVLEEEAELYLAVWLESGHVGSIFATKLNRSEIEGWQNNGIESCRDIMGVFQTDFMRGASHWTILRSRTVDTKLQHKIVQEIAQWDKEKGHL